MDPVAVFHHSDVARECISERNWQKLNTDRATSFRFDATGRYLAIYVNYSTIEIWDITSIPVPVSCLILPKSIANKVDGFCHALQWSACSTQIVGVFGTRPAPKRKAVSEAETTGMFDGSRSSYLVAWDIIDRKLLHKYRLPFPVSSLSTILPIGCPSARSPYYTIGSAVHSCLFLLNIGTGQILQLSHIGDLEPRGVLVDTIHINSAERADTDSFAQWWAQHCSTARGGELPAGRELLLPTASVSRGGEIFVAYATTTQDALANGTRYSTLVHMEFALENTSEECGAQQGGGDSSQEVRCHLLRSLTLPGHMLVQSLSLDEGSQLLSATSEKCGILLFSTAAGDVRLVSEHHPTDRDTVDLLNAQSAGFNMRSAAKYHSAATRKLNTVLYGATASFRCTYSGFYSQMQSHGVENTRFTNNLRPHTLLPVPPAPIRRIESSNALSSGSNGQRVPGHQESEQYRTSVVYYVQSTHQKSSSSAGACTGSLIMWDLDIPAADRDGKISSDEDTSSTTNGHCRAASTLAAQVVRAIGLPPGEIVQIEASPLRTTAYGSARSDSASNHVVSSRSRFAHQPARQIIACIDAVGSVHILRPQYKTDFPGPMYPIGYTLITKVIEYLEREDELDALPGSNGNSSTNGIGSVSGVSGASGGSGDAVGVKDESSGSALATSASSGSIVVMPSVKSSSYATLSDAPSTCYSSVDSLVGLQFLEGNSPVASAARGVLKSEHFAVTLAPEVSVDVTALVVASSGVTKAEEPPRLPFTFADDWLRYPTQTASAAASKGSDLASPVRSLRDSAKLGLLSPQSPWRGTGDLAIGAPGAMEVAEEDGTATEVGTSSSGVEVFSVGFEAYLPAPVRVENGDFEGKLLRQRMTLETLKNAILEPHRVGEKLRQLQEEAVHAVYHAEALKVKKLQRQATVKAQRDEERAKQLMQQQEQGRAQQLAQQAQVQRQGTAPASGSGEFVSVLSGPSRALIAASNASQVAAFAAAGNYDQEGTGSAAAPSNEI